MLICMNTLILLWLEKKNISSGQIKELRGVVVYMRV